MSSTTCQPYDALLLLSFGGPEKPEDVVPFLENVTARPGHPARAAGGGRPALLPLRRPQPDQRPEPRAARRDARATWPAAASTCRSTGATATGTPTCATRCEQMAADGITRAAVLRHQRVLVVLRVPPVPREPRRRRRGGRGRAAARPAAAVLQPPRLRGAGRRRHPGRARRAARGRARAAAHLVFVTHSIPIAMADDERPGAGGAYVAPAPQRGRGDRRAGPPGDRPPPRRTTWSTARAPAPPHVPWLEPDVNDHLAALHAARRARRW